MKLTVYFQDLKDEFLGKMHAVLRDELAEEIMEIMEQGAEREAAELEAIDRYLNTHNFGWEIKL